MDPLLGTWKITVELDGAKEVQTFKVEEYILPKFEVTIKPQPFVLVNARNINLTVCADYTYGQPVQGVVNLNVCLTDSSSYYRQPLGHPQRPCYTNTYQIKGCEQFHIDADSIHLRFSNYTIHSSKLRIEAEVEETGTGVILNGTKEENLADQRLILAFISPDYFKPGLSYYGRLTVMNPDDTPAAGELINLKLTGRGETGVFTRVQNLTSNSDGVIDFELPTMPTDTIQVQIYASALLHKETNIPRNPIHNLNSPTGVKYMKPWYSPSGRFMQMEPLDKTARCGESVNLKITFTTEGNHLIKFYYQVLTLGNIVLTEVQSHSVPEFASPDRTTLDPTSPDRGEAGTQEPPGNTPAWVLPTTTTVAPPLPFVSTFTLKLGITPAMSPKARVLVYYITDNGETVADSIDFEVEECLENKVEMTFDAAQKMPDQPTQPGQPIKLKLTADPDSVCAVAVVDKSVHLLGGNGQLQMPMVFAVLDRYDIKSDRYSPFVGDSYCREKLSATIPRQSYPGPYEYYSQYYDSEQAFSHVGMLVLTDLDVATRPCNQRRAPQYLYMRSSGGPQPVMRDGSLSGAPVATSAVAVRSYFPETWLWDLQYIGESGTFEVPRFLPHTITEWVGSTFCTNQKSGLGVSKLATITTFKPFFVSFTLPYSVIRNERVRLPVTMFNYLTECLAVDLTMVQSPEYDVIGQVQRPVCVCGGQSKTEYFQIVMKKLGHVNVTVSAVSVENSAGVCKDQNAVMDGKVGRKDAVSRQLLVEPEGTEMEYSYSEFFCLNNSQETAVVNLTLPDSDVVPDSARGQVSVIGDVMGPTLAGLERLLRMPMGCGEQNMLLFVPNIYVLQYLTNTQKLSAQLETRAKNFMETGYQRELNYRHKDGSYSAFGERDTEGSTWLTGFVVKSFAQAQPYIFIDERDLNISIQWFRNNQQKNGCFPKIGRVIHSDMKGGLSSGDTPATLTTYILIALLEAGIHETDTLVAGALRCLDSESPRDTYTIALMAYAYSLWKPTSVKTNNMMEELKGRNISSDGMMHWTKSGYTPTPPPPSQGWFTPPYHKATSADVEMSAYALMAYLTQQDGIEKGLPIVKWLSSQRNAYGGFKSTQDTVVALQALAQYASKTYSENLKATVEVISVQTFPVNDENRLVLQRATVTVPTILDIQARGTGCFFVQANIKYNIFHVASPAESAFQFQLTASRTGDCKKGSILVCAKYNGPEEASNMVVVEVKMVSGWVADKKSIGELMNTNIQLKKFEIQQKMVNFYFDELTTSMKCFSFTVTQEVEVTDAKPGMAKVYDYYQNEKSVSTTYVLPVCR